MQDKTTKTIKEKREKTQQEIDKERELIKDEIEQAKKELEKQQKYFNTLITKQRSLDYKFMPDSMIRLCEQANDTEAKEIIDMAIKEYGVPNFEWGGNERIKSTKEFAKFVMVKLEERITTLNTWHRQFQREYDPD
jgi:hypothetical protein